MIQLQYVREEITLEDSVSDFVIQNIKVFVCV